MNATLPPSFVSLKEFGIFLHVIAITRRYIRGKIVEYQQTRYFNHIEGISMKTIKFTCLLCCFAAAFLFSSCSSSQNTQQQKETNPPPNQVQKQPEQQPAPSANDTSKSAPAPVNTTNPSNNPPPPTTTQSTTTPTATPGMPVGTYSVQVGAFSDPSKAQTEATMTRGRVTNTVYVFFDSGTNMTKVTVGDFNDKDTARAFRDQLIQQYPDDYKDAWVLQVPHN
jgi:hypothetical protein